jgi:hypothetical protein
MQSENFKSTGTPTTYRTYLILTGILIVRIASHTQQEQLIVKSLNSMMVYSGGIEKDLVAWENDVSGWSVTATTGKSIYRSNFSTDTDTNVDWVVGTPTP